MTPRKTYRRLTHLCKQKALHQANLDFTIACLDHNVIPHGLKITKTPLVSGELVTRRDLLAKWESTLRKASRLLLKHLERYHKSVLAQLENEIKEEEATVNNRRNFVERTSAIHHYENRIVRKQEEYKRSKLERLIKETKGKRIEKSNRRSYVIKKKWNRRVPRITDDDIGVNTVVNLSSSQLSTAETSLLSKGLTFCPLPPRLDTFQLKKDFIHFTRRLRLKEYSRDTEDDSEEDEAYKPLRRTSVWTPPINRDTALETYIKAIENSIQEQIQRPRKFYRDNLTREER